MSDTSSAAISRRNLISKLRFVRFGPTSENSPDAFKQDLYAYHNDKRPNLISKQTILYWVEGTNNPSRENGLSFILSYMEDCIHRDELPEERRKVHDQILRYLKSVLSKSQQSIDDDKIYVSSNNRVIIDISANISDNKNISDSIKGHYFTYRMRLTPSGNQISQEVMRIYSRGNDIRFEHWFLRDASYLDKFDGSAFVFGNVLWFFGTAVAAAPRMRVIHFPHIKSENPKYTNTRWGILSSNLPLTASDPASCRILIIRQQEPITVGSDFLKKSVRHIEKSEFNGRKEEVIKRLIDNNKTSNLMPGAPEKTTVDSQGLEIQDHLLRISQSTLEIILNSTDLVLDH